jgi:GT2 family glycosyltransferase
MTETSGHPLIYIIIVNWNGWRDTINCIESLMAVDYPNFVTLVIDNASTNDSVEQIRSAFPDLLLLEMEKNLGFTGGNNTGINYALDNDADYVLLLNNDVIVDPDFLSAMAEVMENEATIGALNPKIYYLNHPEEDTFWAAGGKTNLWLAVNNNRGQDQIDRGQFEKPAEIDFGTGCCLMISREALDRTGLLDDAYFVYFEDADWSYRLRRAGLTVNYTPDAKIWHAVTASSKAKVTGGGTLSPFVYYLAARNQLWFVRSYASYLQKITAYPAYFVRRILLNSAAFIVLRRWEKLQALWRGFFAGLKKKPDLIPQPVRRTG